MTTLTLLTREQDEAVAEAARLHECGVLCIETAAAKAHRQFPNCNLTVAEIAEYLRESIKASA